MKLVLLFIYLYINKSCCCCHYVIVVIKVVGKRQLNRIILPTPPTLIKSLRVKNSIAAVLKLSLINSKKRVHRTVTCKQSYEQ